MPPALAAPALQAFYDAQDEGRGKSAFLNGKSSRLSLNQMDHFPLLCQPDGMFPRMEQNLVM